MVRIFLLLLYATPSHKKPPFLSFTQTSPDFTQTSPDTSDFAQFHSLLSLSFAVSSLVFSHTLSFLLILVVICIISGHCLILLVLPLVESFLLYSLQLPLFTISNLTCYFLFKRFYYSQRVTTLATIIKGLPDSFGCSKWFGLRY